MNYGLHDTTLNKLTALFNGYPTIEKVILYGSRAKGTFKNGSDIDLTILGDGLDLELLNKISNEIDDLLLPYTVDISLFSHITNLDLIDHIQRIGVVFYQRTSPKC